MSMMMMMSTAMTIILALMGIFFYMSEMNPKNMEMKMSFECGFNSIINKKSSFSTNFFMLLILFLVFDVEVSFLIPIIMMESKNMVMMSTSTLFIMLLVILLKKEWKQGMVEWNK